MLMLFPLLQVFLARQILLTIHPDIYFGGRDPAAYYPRYFQPRPHVQSGNCVFEQLRRNSGIDEGAHEHVAADAGKTLKISDAHRKLTNFSS